MAKIFISYNRESKAIAGTLVNDIETLGHSVWFDQEISGGRTWWDQILAQVRECDVFVFVLDPAALDSMACKSEYLYAATLGKPILPVLVSEQVSTNLLPAALSRIQFVDYRKEDREAAFRLARALHTIPPAEPLPNPLPATPDVPISYLGTLTEQIDSKSTISFEQQSVLVADLRRSLRDSGTAYDTRRLLERLRKRRDLFAAFAEEVDELLGQARILASVDERDPNKAKPTRKELILRKRNIMIALSVLVIVTIAILVWTWQSRIFATRSSDGIVAKSITETLPTTTPLTSMLLVPAGKFTMGRNEKDGGDEYERPAHQVTMKSFLIDRYEVTSEEYKKCVDEKRCRSPQGWVSGSYPAGTARHPVTGVTWDDANDYATWSGKRLPTEEEWEYAARGADGWRYPWGNEWKPELANADGASNGMVDVGTYKGVSPFGVFDMVGNAWEWTASELKPYPGGKLSQKPGSDIKVLRGGNYETKRENATTTYRYPYHARGEVSYATSGFRCVKDK